MNLLKLASKAAQISANAAKHLDTADRLLTEAQKHADTHLAGTDLHKKLASRIAVAKGHVGTAQAMHTQLRSVAKSGGARRRKRTSSRRRKSKSSKRRRTRRRM